MATTMLGIVIIKELFQHTLLDNDINRNHSNHCGNHYPPERIMHHDRHRILAVIDRAEKRIQEAHEHGSSEQSNIIEQLEQEHIDKLRNMLAEPMSANIVEDSFN